MPPRGAEAPYRAEVADTPYSAEAADTPYRAEVADSPYCTEAADFPYRAKAAYTPYRAEDADCEPQSTRLLLAVSSIEEATSSCTRSNTPAPCSMSNTTKTRGTPRNFSLVTADAWRPGWRVGYEELSSTPVRRCRQLTAATSAMPLLTMPRPAVHAVPIFAWFSS